MLYLWGSRHELQDDHHEDAELSADMLQQCAQTVKVTEFRLLSDVEHYLSS